MRGPAPSLLNGGENATEAPQGGVRKARQSPRIELVPAKPDGRLEGAGGTLNAVGSDWVRSVFLRGVGLEEDTLLDREPLKSPLAGLLLKLLGQCAERDNRWEVAEALYYNII